MNHDAILEVSMFSTEAGGRKGPTPPDKFGCLFKLGDQYFDCRLDLSSTGPISPGQKVSVPVAFLYREDVLSRLEVGAFCELHDGRVIANAVVREVFRD